VLGAGNVTLAGTGATFTDASGATITTGTISGFGVFAAGLTTTAGNTAHITANGGTLEVSGTITDTAGTLVLTDTAGSDTLKLDAAGSTAHTLTLNGGKLLLNGNTAALTVGTQAVLGAGKVTLAGTGATFTDASGATITTGTISGFGVFAAGLTTTAGNTAHITANGGTLEVSGTITDTANKLVLTDTASSDTLKLDAAGNTAHTVTLNGGMLLLNGNSAALTVGTLLAIGAGTVSLQGTGATLTDTATNTIAGGTISGTGTIAANTNITGSGTISIPISTAGTLTASGGTLDLTGTVSGRTLAIVAGSILKIDGIATTLAATSIAIANATQTLEIGTAGSLTISAAESISNGTIKLDGGTASLTDASGITVNNSATLTGQGTVDVTGGTLTGSGTGVIKASGGTLDLKGTVSGGSSLQIDSTSGSTLKIENTATTTAAINTSSLTSLNSASKLEIGTSGNLTIGAAETVAGGTIQLDGGTLTDSAGLTVSSGTLIGHGTVTASIVDNGTIDASAGRLNITGNVSGTGVLKIEDSSTLDLQSAASTSVSPVVNFNGTSANNQIVQIDSTQSSYSLTVQGSSWLYASQKFDFTKISFASASGSYNSSTHIYTLTDGTHTALITVSGGKSGSILIAQDSGTGTYVYDPPDITQSEPANGPIGNGEGAIASATISSGVTLEFGAAGTQTVSFAGAMDNVEGYAPGLPILALAGNDHLTGTGGNDPFVFGQPIGNDTIYNFNAASDKIDLVGFNIVTSFSDIKTHLTDDANGDAVITLGDGQSITLHGIDAASLTPGDFVFDQTPVTNNAGSIVIGDDAMLPLSGTINNTGRIALSSTGHETDLQVIGHGVTLEGGARCSCRIAAKTSSPAPIRASR
jgi:hypothetical protein